MGRPLFHTRRYLASITDPFIALTGPFATVAVAPWSQIDKTWIKPANGPWMELSAGCPAPLAGEEGWLGPFQISDDPGLATPRLFTSLPTQVGGVAFTAAQLDAALVIASTSPDRFLAPRLDLVFHVDPPPWHPAKRNPDVGLRAVTPTASETLLYAIPVYGRALTTLQFSTTIGGALTYRIFSMGKDHGGAVQIYPSVGSNVLPASSYDAVTLDTTREHLLLFTGSMPAGQLSLKYETEDHA